MKDVWQEAAAVFLSKVFLLVIDLKRRNKTIRRRTWCKVCFDRTPLSCAFPLSIVLSTHISYTDVVSQTVRCQRTEGLCNTWNPSFYLNLKRVSHIQAHAPGSLTDICKKTPQVLTRLGLVWQASGHCGVFFGVFFHNHRRRCVGEGADRIDLQFFFVMSPCTGHFLFSGQCSGTVLFNIYFPKAFTASLYYCIWTSFVCLPCV